MTDIVRHRGPHGLVRRWPAPFGGLFRDLWEDFDDEFGSVRGLFGTRFIPELDVRENESELVVAAELPGVSKDDVHISVHGGVLTIKGQKRQEEETKDGGYYRSERRYGAFERSIRLPEYVDEQNVDATFKDGVLKLTLPKREEVRPKTIPIKEG